MSDDLAAMAALLGAALRSAGVPADPGRCERFARAVTLAQPATARALYLCALATLVSGQEQIAAFDQVFGAFFGGPSVPAARSGRPAPQPARGDTRTSLTSPELLAEATRAARTHAGRPDPRPGHRRNAEPGPAARPSAGQAQPAGPGEEGDVRGARPVIASAAERLADADFADLTPAELALLAGLMRKLTLALPLRRSRRPRRVTRGGRADLRSTLRQARRTGGHPVRLTRRAPLREPRRLVVLCDISGSMEPYARAMLQLLYCAAGGAQAEVFTFATRLTRLTGALARVRPTIALQQAGQSAPDWLGGTRIGASVKDFNDRYGRRGMARGAVVVIISDGWDTGDPGLLRREMERLSLVAHRIVWVNPRTQDRRYRPLAGGMAAAWPYCDAVVSGHSLHALDELTAALAQGGRRRRGAVAGVRSPAWPPS